MKNEYFAEKYKDDNTRISIHSDGKDYSNVDFGENVGDKKITKNDLKNSEYYAETKICETICIESKQSLNKQRELDEFFRRKYGNGVNNGSDVRRQMKKDIAETIESNAGPLENQSNALNIICRFIML